MRLKKYCLLLFCSCSFIFSTVKGQNIFYSQPYYENDDAKTTQHFIVGQMNENIVIGKKSKRGFGINVYNQKMGIISSVIFKEITENIKVLTILNCIDHAIVFFIQKLNLQDVLYGLILNANGVPISEAVLIDTIVSNFGLNYSVVFAMSENKKHISCLIQNTIVSPAILKHITLNPELEIQKKTNFSLTLYNNENINRLLVNNRGETFFVQPNTNKHNGFKIYDLRYNSDTCRIKTFDLKNIKLNDFDIKIDNFKNRIIVYGLFHTLSGTGHSMYYQIIDEHLNIVEEANISFKQRTNLNNTDIDLNNTEIKNLFISRDSALTFVLEQNYEKEYQEFLQDNRINLNSRFSNGFGINIPLPSKSVTKKNFFSNDIYVIKIKNKEMVFINDIIKKQDQKEINNLLSHYTFNTGGQLHFLYNNFMLNGNVVLNDIIVYPKGQSQKLTLTNKINKSYNVNIKDAVQILPQTFICPCISNNGVLCFMKFSL